MPTSGAEEPESWSDECPRAPATAAATAATVNSALSLLQAATFAGHRGEAERAATLFGAGDRHLAMHKAPFMERVYQAGIDPALETLGADRYQEIYDLGAQMSVEEATGFLLSR